MRKFRDGGCKAARPPSDEDVLRIRQRGAFKPWGSAVSAIEKTQLITMSEQR